MEEIKNKSAAQLERVALDAKSIVKIDGWIKQITDKYKGPGINRKEILEWLIDIRDAVLPKHAEREIVERYYTEERVLKDTLKKIQSAKVRGERLSVADLMSSMEIFKVKSQKTQGSK